MPTPTPLIRVSVSEAARLFGLNPRTIRRAIAAGEITYIVVRGRYKINFESLIKWSQQKGNIAKKREIRKELAKGHNERVGRGIVPRQCRPELYLRG